MKCPNCSRDLGQVESFPVTCSCLMKISEDGSIVHRVDKPIPSKPKPSIKEPEPVGTHLASLIPDWAKSMKGGCSCKDWEAKMNRWGVAGCKSRREQIVNHLMSQQEHLAKPLQALPDVLKRLAAGKLVDIAIRRSTKD